MKVGVEFPTEWKVKSKEKNILLSDLLYGFVVEDFFLRLKKSSFYELLLLQSEYSLGEDAYKKKVKDRLDFFYLKSEKKIFTEKLVPGQALSLPVIELLVLELFSKDLENEIIWKYEMKESEGQFYIHLQAKYLEMQVPVTIRLEELSQSPKVLKEIQIPRLFKEGKNVSCMCYSKENILSENLFEMMSKLELVSDMAVYDNVNEIIKKQTISGRHIMEELQSRAKKEPKVLNMKRLSQIESYRNYGYMKKRWQQYAKRHKKESEEWEDVLDRILKFTEPIWSALCKNEIFFDDWMPDLERFFA